MFSRLTRFTSMPLPLTNGISRLVEGQTAPKVAQTEDGGAAALPTVPPPLTGPWKDEMADPFLGSALPREDFLELAGTDFGAWDTCEGLSWHERPMDLVNHVQMTPRKTPRPEVNCDKSLSLFKDPFNIDAGFLHGCYNMWQESYQPGFFDDLGLEDLKLDPLDDLCDIKLDPFYNPDKVKVEPCDEESFALSYDLPELLFDPVKEEPLESEVADVETGKPPGQFRGVMTSCISQAIPSKRSSTMNVYLGSSAADNVNQPYGCNDQSLSDAAVRKRPARNCKRRSVLEMLNPDYDDGESFPAAKNIHLALKRTHPPVIKEEVKIEEIDVKPDLGQEEPSIGDVLVGKARGVRYKPCFDDAEFRRRAMNRTSARKYRMKKRVQKLALSKERVALEVKNADLRTEAALLQRNIDDFRRRLGF